MISFVDLPGIGTPNFPDLPTYCEKVGLETYDTFLIFTATRFTKNDLELAKKVKEIGKSFFLIRTKIDVDLAPKKGKAPINEAAMLQKIRSNLMDNVRDLISSEKELFLISNYDKDKWDFNRLIAAIGVVLPVRQRESLILSLSSVTRECLKRKANILKASAFAVALVSAATGTIPVPVVGSVINAGLIAGTCTIYYRQFGLHDRRLEEIALLDRKYWEIVKKLCIHSITDLASPILPKTSALTLGGIFESTPTVKMVKSFCSTLHYLVIFVDECEEAALAVWDKTAKQSI
ncbi:interferon-inducible GTPase 5-like [Paramuricea clavata]|uniref:Interferon-inducible GTPase 5-like n=1 Tax=Paramuricea clavata TaxID=317549 RepID=A0A7D9EZD8_PARCT|nr:interferon-inducible GTPase 5-like [Paramuricea clavata]